MRNDSVPLSEIETLRAENERLREDAAKRARLGRRALPPTSPDAILIARVCAARGWSREALAERLGVHRTMLCGPARELPPRLRFEVERYERGAD